MRRRLALLVAATTSLVLVAFVIPLAMLVHTVAEDRAVNAATRAVDSLAPIAATADRRGLALTLGQTNATGEQPVTVFLPDGTVVGAPAPRSAAVRLAARGQSLTAQAPGGREVLTSVGTGGGTAVLRTFVTDAAMHRGVQRAWLILAGLGVVLVLVGVLVADRLARSLVRPMGELSAVSHRLARGELDARAAAEGPAEVRSVATALNHLAGRIRDLLTAEREAVADISHRLRTPLTALRLEAEALRDPAEAERINAGVDALERSITAVITQARGQQGEPGRADAAAVVGERVRFWSALAEDTEREVRAELAPGPIPVRLSQETLAAGVDALLGNVFAHTPDGTGFTVLLTARPEGGARIVVRDQGPGFPDAPASRRGVSGAGSTGLGLDIARRAAREAGGELALGAAPGGGAEVRVELGAPLGNA
ncbi:sensor histidine kinase [Sciscionella marina]|uniref:sensor histidine kinase n=1 Tax=Sciscionella marina TaxID=508770 RepID=UPI000372AF14|nr:HAMP domain-containing sensor histidine kinase [Sciscionella marina]